MEYMLEYIGTINVVGQMSGLPPQIRAYAFVETTTREGLAKAVDGELTRFINMRGMCVSDDPAKMTDANSIDLDNRMFVPMDQILYIKAKVKPLTGQLNADPEGLVKQ